jgi:hypothetical protein
MHAVWEKLSFVVREGSATVSLPLRVLFNLPKLLSVAGCC